MLTQIYEIANPTQAKEVAEAGTDHVGVLVGSGEYPREINIEQATKILEAIPAKSKSVVLTLSRDLKAIEQIAIALNPDILHLGTIPEGLSTGNIRDLKRKLSQMKIMRSIPVTGWESVELAKQYDGIVDFLLLDSHQEDDNQVGATGKTHDWRISRRIVESVNCPVILAGGLGPENVLDAIRIVHPAGVDSKTKTDKFGTHEKDIVKVRSFVLNASGPMC
jgi:phosphoribosylanthranilate isomerase